MNVSALMEFTQESREMCRGHGGNLRHAPGYCCSVSHDEPSGGGIRVP